MSEDFYSALGVSRDAGEDEIKQAYRKKAAEYHPDVSDDPNADEKFKNVKKAKEVLLDDEKRRMYDQMGHERFAEAEKRGATETGPLITTSDARRYFEDDSEERFAVKKTQGIGYLGTDVRVVDEDGNDVDEDGQSIGEIVVRGNQVMDRYLGKPDATEEAFNDRIEGYYHMGDLATVDENGMVQIQDRKKDIIISGGENISSIELEDTLFEHPEVSDVAIIPAPSDEWGETPKAFVVPTSGDPDAPGVSEDELTEFTRENLASYKMVRRVEFVEELPTTATGKIQKYELREREWEDEDSMVGQG